MMMFAVATIAVLVTIGMVLARAILGPSLFDRVLAGNTVGSLAVLTLALIGFVTGRPEFLDIGILYTLLNLIGTIAVLRYFKMARAGESGAGKGLGRMEMVLDILSWVFLLAGGAFCLIGGLGMLRMPDVYTRLHAVSVIETLGMGGIILGLILQAGFTLVAAKLIIIAARHTADRAGRHPCAGAGRAACGDSAETRS